MTMASLITLNFTTLLEAKHQLLKKSISLFKGQVLTRNWTLNGAQIMVQDLCKFVAAWMVLGVLYENPKELKLVMLSVD
jgi:hypothetical protein